MKIDTTSFPLVWMRFKVTDPATDAAPFAGFEALLARRTPFVLLNDEGLDSGRAHEHSHEERRRTSVWMKQHKSELREFVKAAIYIEPDNARRLAAASFAQGYIKFWGYPMILANSLEEALNKAEELLQ
ncbi:hypothetical protein NJI34_07470 [Pseudomonas sp. S 311-6]|nr:hypothetical protein [Pseudomonas sp. S 311-6]